jgi:hypothetical protein
MVSHFFAHYTLLPYRDGIKQTMRTVINERRASPKEHETRTDFLQYLIQAKPDEDPEVMATIMLAILWAGHTNTVCFQAVHF